MELTSLIFPQTKNICRTCLAESDTAMAMDIEDLVEYEMKQIKIIDILLFLNCLENKDLENWPHGMCKTCVSTALSSYNFKLNCLKVNSTLTQILSIDNLPQPDLDSIDIDVIYQDHEYGTSLFNSAQHQDHEYGLPLLIQSAQHQDHEYGIPASNQPVQHQDLQYETHLLNQLTQHQDHEYGLPLLNQSTQYQELEFETPPSNQSVQHHQDLEYETPPSNQSGQHHQDHEYGTPLVNHPTSSVESNTTVNNNKELAPLPPVSELTATKLPPRQEGEKCYTCDLCSKSFTRIHSMRYHIAKHSACKFLCAKCGKSFHTKNALTQHMQSHKELAILKCGFCEKTYKKRQSLRSHFCIAHSSNSKSLVCDTCGKRFSSQATLRQHSKIHSGQQRFTCPHCPKVYSRALYLKRHMLDHNGEERPRPFICNYINCNRRFHAKNGLLVHIAHVHTNERPYKCDRCSWRFATAIGLKEHKDNHNPKRLACDSCPKKFSSVRALQKHAKTHEVSVNDTILANNDIVLENNDSILQTVVDSVFLDHCY